MNRIILIAFLFIAGCNSNQDNSKVAEKVVDDSTKESTKSTNTSPDLNGCFVSVIKRDTANLKLNINNGEVSGSLVYDRFEKDGNIGTIKGKMQDSIIIADYTFQSEGMTSVREVVFKIQDEKLIEGYGDIVMKGDTARFKNITQLKFLDEQPFVKGECR